jgi:ABC-type dipeptide/oligopeptide/nickel transport system permease component
MGSKVPESTAATPWLLIGIISAVILSLVAGLTAVLLRQRKKGKLKRKATELIAATAAPKPSFIASVKNRLMPGRTAPAAAAQTSDLPQEVADTVPAL